MPQHFKQFTVYILSLITLVSFSSFFFAACAPKERIAKHRPGERPMARRGRLKSVKPYTIRGITYYPMADAYGYNKTGIASWYGKKFHGRRSASGEIYDMHAMTAAHKTLPLQTMVEVTRLNTGKKIAVRINDRGPFVASRIIDLSYAAANRLGMAGKGTAKVRVVALARGRPGKKGASPVVVGPEPDFIHGRFWVQVGAFSVNANANRLRDRLDFPEKRIRLQPARGAEKETLIRVQIGPFSDMLNADKALKAVRAQGLSKSFVVAD